MAKFAVSQAYRSQDYPAPQGGIREEVPLWSTLARTVESAAKVEAFGARQERLISEARKRRAEIARRTGRDLPKPFSEMGGRAMAADIMLGVDPAQAMERDGGYATDEDFEKQVDDLRAKFPREMAGVETYAQMRKRVDEELRAISGRAAEAFEDHPIAGFAGSVVGSMADPLNAIATVGTGGLGAARPLAQRMLIQAGANAGVEAAQGPLRMLEAQAVGGPEVTAGDVAANVVFSAVAGGAFEAAGAGLARGGRAISDVLFAEATPAAPRRAAQIMATAAGDDRALGAIDGRTLDEVVAALDRGEAPRPSPDRDLSEIFAGVERAELQSGDVAIASSADYKGRTTYQASFDPRAVGAAPDLFQYKADGDGAGVTARLRGVEAWDATAAGQVIVYQDKANALWIADGHQRRGLALRMEDKGFDARLNGFLFREADGWAPAEVRTVAALKNLREGSGTILDAAKIFRDAPEALADRSLPVTGDFISNARGLAMLEPRAFKAVVNKVIDERFAADIGLMAAARPELHFDMVTGLKAMEPANGDEARAFIHEMLLSDWIKNDAEQLALFGDLDGSTSAMVGRAKVAAAVKRALASDARLFSNLVKNADAIEMGGNALARDANEARLAIDRAALAVTSRLALRSGPIGEAMAAAAAKVVRGDKATTAARPVIARVRAAIEAGERFDVEQTARIDPPAPDPAAVALLDGFDDPHGPGAKSQLEPKPEEAEDEAGLLSLFDDFDDEPAWDKAHKALVACAPGGEG